MEKAKLSLLRLGLWLAVLVVAVAVGATALLNRPSAGFGQGSYALVDQTGTPVDQQIFTGHPSLLFFGYTHCPDVCPTTLTEMAAWFETLGADGAPLKAYFVTVDPERDTPAVLGDYVSWISDRIIGLTGPRAEIDKALKAWGAIGEKVPGEGEDYTMNHTASVYLLNPQGGFEGTIAYGENATTAIEKIRKLLAKA
jgi:protein SCO1/2